MSVLGPCGPSLACLILSTFRVLCLFYTQCPVFWLFSGRKMARSTSTPSSWKKKPSSWFKTGAIPPCIILGVLMILILKIFPHLLSPWVHLIFVVTVLLNFSIWWFSFFDGFPSICWLLVVHLCLCSQIPIWLWWFWGLIGGLCPWHGVGTDLLLDSITAGRWWVALSSQGPACLSASASSPTVFAE